MKAVSSIENWFYDSFALSSATNGRPLSSLAFYLFKRMDIVSKFKLNEARLARFLIRMEDGYKGNPYHNRIHAADVLRTTHVFLTRGGVMRAVAEAHIHHSGNHATRTESGNTSVMTSLNNIAQGLIDPNQGQRDAFFASKLFSCYFAAIAHDHEHQGLTNDFLIRVGDDLALRYNDMSPHEMHHVSSTSILLNDDQYNFFPPIKNHKLKEAVRKDLIELVLATDMKQVSQVIPLSSPLTAPDDLSLDNCLAQHFGLCGMFKSKVITPMKENCGLKSAQLPKIKMPSEQSISRSGSGNVTTGQVVTSGQVTNSGPTLTSASSRHQGFRPLSTLSRVGSIDTGGSNVIDRPNDSTPGFATLPVMIEGHAAISVNNVFEGTSSSLGKSGSPGHAIFLSVGHFKDDGKEHKSLASDSQLAISLNDNINFGSRPRLDAKGFALSHLASNPIIHSRPSPVSHDWDAETQMLVLKVAIKCADIGHLASTGATHRKWVSCLEEEMFRQGDKEKTMGLPISPLMDRRKAGVTKSQTGFFNVVAIPLYEAFAEVFSEAKEVRDNLMVNYRMWEKEEKAHAAALAAEAGCEAI